jgi:hypothetical protein
MCFWSPPWKSPKTSSTVATPPTPIVTGLHAALGSLRTIYCRDPTAQSSDKLAAAVRKALDLTISNARLVHDNTGINTRPATKWCRPQDALPSACTVSSELGEWELPGVVRRPGQHERSMITINPKWRAILRQHFKVTPPHLQPKISPMRTMLHRLEKPIPQETNYMGLFVTL